jgi:hypothetical protein
MATDDGVTPGAALGAGEGFGIQCLGDGDGRMALGQHSEDALNDLGLAHVDGPVAAHRFALRVGLPQDFITITQPASRFAAHDPVPEATMVLSAFIVPLRPICSSEISPSAGATSLMLAQI